MRNAIMVALTAFSLVGAAGFAAEPVELQPLAFLLGEWSASGSGQAVVASGTTVFARGLQDRVILRTSYAEYPAADGKAASRHDDLMVIYVAPGGGLRADYYDNEGHVIRYSISSLAAGKALFVSDPVGGQPRFRLSYELEANGELRGEFAIAPPGVPEAFKPYLTWVSRKALGIAK